jgi:flavin-dependent dehydrogenase
VAAGATFAGRVEVERLVRKGDRIAGVEATTDAGPLAIAAEHIVLAVGAKPGLIQRAGLLETRPDPIQTARTYVSGHRGSRDCFEFVFDAELLPGYAWVFPAADGRANVGVGVVPSAGAKKRSARDLLERFIGRECAGGLLSGCEHREPVRGYPLRTDFPSGPVAGAGFALVGEAAGLGNPVTGEGIDLALESGLLAAEWIARDIAAGTADHRGYERALRERFEAMFVGLRRIRDVLLTPVGADYSLWAMSQSRPLAGTLIGVAQGLLPPGRALEPRVLAQLVTPLAPDLLVREMTRLREWWSSLFAGKEPAADPGASLGAAEPAPLRSPAQ